MTEMISRAQAMSLAKLMESTQGYAATSHVVSVFGVDITVIVVEHEDQREGSWQTVHVLDAYTDKSVSVGTIPKEART